MSAPYWGQLPPLKGSQAAARHLADDHDEGLPHEPRLSLDIPTQSHPRANRVSVQTTRSDAPTEDTMSPFASPTASSFQGQGLTPRPPSLPYGANQYPPELIENRRRRKSRNQEQDEDYASVTGPAPPAAPDAPPSASSSHQRYPPARSGPPRSYGKMNDDMATSPALERARQILDESAMPRPKRVGTDPTMGRNSPQFNGRQRRASAAEQSLQRSARRTSTGGSSDRSKAFADVRSPLQRLELTLDSITKEDKRARVEAAERVARERAAATAREAGIPYDEKSPQQVRFRERRPSIAGGEPAHQTTVSVTPTRPPQQRSAPSSASGPLSQNPPSETRRQGSVSGPSPRMTPAESRIPVPVQQSGVPQRNLSFRERAARNDVPLPNGLESPASKAATPTAVRSDPSTPGSGGNKLRKNPPGHPWPNRTSESDELYSPAEAVRSPKTAAGTPKVAHTPQQHQTPQYHQTPQHHQEPLDDDDADEFLPYPRPAKLTKSPGNKADQVLGRVPSQTAATNGAKAAAAAAAAAATVTAVAATATATSPAAAAAAPQSVPHGDHHDVIDDNGERHHVSDYLYHAREKMQPGEGIFKPGPFLEEWKKAPISSLTGNLLDLEDVPPPPDKNANTAWWEGPQTRRRSTSLSSRPKKAEAFEGEYDDTHGMRTPSQKASSYPSIEEVQSGDPRPLFEPQHLVAPSRRAKARAGQRWDGLRPFSPGPSANDSKDSLGCFSLCSNDVGFHKQALSYSCTPTLIPWCDLCVA